MRWGLVLHCAKSEKLGYSMINAVGETVFEKSMYNKLILSQQYLIPASGFYERIRA